MKRSEVFKKLKQLIATEDTWTTKTNARNAEGYSVDPFEGTAVCWCVNGAMIAVISESSEKNVYDYPDLRAEYGRSWNYLTMLAHELYEMSAPRVNDRLGFSAIHKLLDVAIARLEAEDQ